MNTKCRWWRDCGVMGGGCCARGKYGGRPSHGVCRICPHYDGPSRGLGDVIHRVAGPVGRVINRLLGRKIFGSSGCGCHGRRVKLNVKSSFID